MSGGSKGLFSGRSGGDSFARVRKVRVHRENPIRGDERGGQFYFGDWSEPHRLTNCQAVDLTGCGGVVPRTAQVKDDRAPSAVCGSCIPRQ